MGPSALLLDMDDTMVDATESYRQATIATAAAFGVAVAPRDITAAKAAGGANDDWELTWRLISRGGARASLEEVTGVFERFYQGDGRTVGMKEKERPLVSRELLARWSKERPLAVVTGRPRVDALWFLERHDLASLFRAVVTMDDGPLKPDPAPVRLALSLLGVSDAWMVGDTPDDMRAAVAAGIKGIGVVAPADDPAVARAALLAAGAWKVVSRLPDLDSLL